MLRELGPADPGNLTFRVDRFSEAPMLSGVLRVSLRGLRLLITCLLLVFAQAPSASALEAAQPVACWVERGQPQTSPLRLSTVAPRNATAHRAKARALCSRRRAPQTEAPEPNGRYLYLARQHLLI